VIVEANAQPTLFGNIFKGVGADAFRALGDQGAAAIGRDNWFVDAPDPAGRGTHAAARGRSNR